MYTYVCIVYVPGEVVFSGAKTVVAHHRTAQAGRAAVVKRMCRLCAATRAGVVVEAQAQTRGPYDTICNFIYVRQDKVWRLLNC